MTGTVGLQPVFPLMQVVLLMAGLVAGVVWLYRAEKTAGRVSVAMTALRAVCVGLVCLLLLNPVIVLSSSGHTGKTPLLVLLDSSHSMAVKDVDGKSRLDAAKESLIRDVRTLQAVSGTHDVSLFSFDTEAVRREPLKFGSVQPSGPHTYIGEAMARSLSTVAGSRSGAVLLVSDGRNNGEASPVEVARQIRSKGFAVFTVCLGAATKSKDAAVTMTRRQVFVAPDQEGLVSADLSSSGLGGKVAVLHLLREGSTVATKTVPVRDAGHTEVTFPVKEPAKGTYRYTVSVEGLPGEATLANNRSSTLVTVGNLTSKVLVLEGRPTWDVKFLVQTLRNDPAVKVDAIYKLSEKKFFAVKGSEGEATQVKVPTTRSAFAAYDVVMIGQGVEEFFDETAAKQLQAYVSEDGGHVVFLRGRAYAGSEALAALEPVTWSEQEVTNLRLKLTEEGIQNPAFTFGKSNDPQTIVQKLPTLVSATQVASEKALSVVLARAGGLTNTGQPNREMAVLAYQRYGQGLVASLVGEGLWRWALLPPELEGYGSCYSDFWTNLVRWMAGESDFLPGQNVALRTDHLTYSPAEPVSLMVFVRGRRLPSAPAVKIAQPDGKTTIVALGQGAKGQADFSGTYRPKLPGDYLASVPNGSGNGQVTVPFSVFERQEEDINTSSDAVLMRQIAAAGGGEALNLAQLHDLSRFLHEAETALLKKTDAQSMWDKWPVLALLLSLLCAEWILRRRAGMV